MKNERIPVQGWETDVFNLEQFALPEKRRGRFGWHWGIVSGFLHSSVAQSVGQLHGGLVLCNNEFAAGLVAVILVPVIIAVPPRESGRD